MVDPLVVGVAGLDVDDLPSVTVDGFALLVLRDEGVEGVLAHLGDHVGDYRGAVGHEPLDVAVGLFERIYAGDDLAREGFRSPFRGGDFETVELGQGEFVALADHPSLVQACLWLDADAEFADEAFVAHALRLED